MKYLNKRVIINHKPFGFMKINGVKPIDILAQVSAYFGLNYARSTEREEGALSMWLILTNGTHEQAKNAYSLKEMGY